MKFVYSRAYVSFMLIACTGLFFNFSKNVMAFDAAEAFQAKCSGCHSLGSDDLVGPGLKDVTKRRTEEWLIKFITNPQAMIDAGDATAVELKNKYNLVMPAQDLTEDEIKEMIKFLDLGEAAAIKKVLSALDATPEIFQMGKELFNGDKKFSAGGPACYTCHSAGTENGFLGGGSVGPDLTHSYGIFGDLALTDLIANMNSTSKLKVYQDKLLTEDEVHAVKSYLYKVDLEDEQGFNVSKKFLILGIFGFFAILILIKFVLNKKK